MKLKLVTNGCFWNTKEVYTASNNRKTRYIGRLPIEVGSKEDLRFVLL